MPTMQVITVSVMAIARCLYLSARKATSTAITYVMTLMDFTASQRERFLPPRHWELRSVQEDDSK